jgi:microcystin-dependent protein
MKKIYIIIVIALLSTTKNFSQNAYLGEIRVFPFGFAPRFWAECNGQLLPISQNQALFSILGTTYGGNGQTNFALPDLRGRVIVGVGTNKTLGQSAGAETVALTAANLPIHTHSESIKVSTAAATNGTPIASDAIGVAKMTVGAEVLNVMGYNTTAPDTPLAGVPTTATGTASPTAVNKTQPGLPLVYCISLQGVFPSQN